MQNQTQNIKPLKLSIVTPVYHEGPHLAGFARDLIGKTQSIESVERIVVNGDVNEVLTLAEPGIKVIESDKGRARQMNAGAAQCSGDYILFLHCDTELPADLAEWWRTLGHIRPSWGFFPVRLSGHKWPFRMIERAISWRSAWSGIATGDQAQFVKKSVFDEIGGFPVIPLMEDVALSKRLKKCAAPWVWHSPVKTSSRRWEQKGVWRTIALMWWLRFAYMLGVSPVTLARWYRG